MTAKELVDQREQELLAEDEKTSGVYLTYLLSNKNVTRDEIYSNVMEMLIAATDTVSDLTYLFRRTDCYCWPMRYYQFINNGGIV